MSKLNSTEETATTLLLYYCPACGEWVNPRNDRIWREFEYDRREIRAAGCEHPILRRLFAGPAMTPSATLLAHQALKQPGKRLRQEEEESISNISSIKIDSDPPAPKTNLTHGELLERLGRLHDSKGLNYSGAPDSYENLHAAATAIGVPAWKYVLARMREKFARVQNFAQGQVINVSSETIEDTMLDIANFALIWLVLYAEALENVKNC